MTPIIVWDTETTGFPVWGSPSGDPAQPHIVQLAAIMVDFDTRRTIASVDLIIEPDGWTIPDEVVAIHGITTEHALYVGVPERDAVALFLALGDGLTHVAHNSSFDERIMRIATKRFFGDEMAEWFKTNQKFECTKILATPIVALPPTGKMVKAGFSKHKPPTLAEAYEFLMGKPLEGAHNAMADALGCMDVYFAINDRQAASQ